jgi:hypothetical protein
LILQLGDVPPARLWTDDATPPPGRLQLFEHPMDEALGLAARHEAGVAKTTSDLRWRCPRLSERPDHRPDDVARQHDRLLRAKIRPTFGKVFNSAERRPVWDSGSKSCVSAARSACLNVNAEAAKTRLHPLPELGGGHTVRAAISGQREWATGEPMLVPRAGGSPVLSHVRTDHFVQFCGNCSQ